MRHSRLGTGTWQATSTRAVPRSPRAIFDDDGRRLGAADACCAGGSAALHHRASDDTRQPEATGYDRHSTGPTRGRAEQD